MGKIFLLACLVSLSGCQSQKAPDRQETTTAAAPTPPSNVVSAYGQNLAASVQKAKTVTAAANKAVATTDQETQKVLSE